MQPLKLCLGLSQICCRHVRAHEQNTRTPRSLHLDRGRLFDSLLPKEFNDDDDDDVELAAVVCQRPFNGHAESLELTKYSFMTHVTFYGTQNLPLTINYVITSIIY